MAAGNFLSAAEEKKLVDLISELEQTTTGEIHVHIAKKTSRHGIMSDAARTFKKLGMTKTSHHNGVLLYISLKNRELACIGDKAIHSKLGDHGWKIITDRLLSAFAKGQFHSGLETALKEIGATLRTHFPAADGTGSENSLPNEFSKS